jgi:hypothetical protein
MAAACVCFGVATHRINPAALVGLSTVLGFQWRHVWKFEQFDAPTFSKRTKSTLLRPVATAHSDLVAYG